MSVIRCDLLERTREISTSETVEKSFLLDEDVYMKITLRSGPGENRIEIMEFWLCRDVWKEHLKIDHGIV